MNDASRLRGILGLAWLLFVPSALATSSLPSRHPDILAVQNLIQTPDASVDFAKAKLTIDRIIAPDTSSVAVARELDRWVARIQARTPPLASRRQRLDVLLETLYQPGSWNDRKPFGYDLSDPFGKTLKNKLLATYLRTRKGNCVSMPILVAVLGQKLGLPITLSTAPEHVLAKYLDDSGQWLNIEATAGGFKYDSSYERELEIGQKAIANQIYLRPLRPQEAVGVLLSTLMEHYHKQGQYPMEMAVAGLALRANAKDVVAMQHLGGANYMLIQTVFAKQYPNPNHIPIQLQGAFVRMQQDNLAWYARAEALGWAPSSEARNADYLRNIERESPRGSDMKVLKALSIGLMSLLLAASPAFAKFVSVDPVQANANNGQNFNRYNYANNNPFRFYDPDGRQAMEKQAEQYRKDAESGNWGVYKPFEKPALFLTAAMIAGPGAGSVYSRMLMWAGENYGKVATITELAAGVAGVSGTAGSGLLMRQASETLKPGGKLIGTPGTSSAIRMVDGGLNQARAIFSQATQGGQVVRGTSYPGTLMRVGDNVLIGLRESSTMGNRPPTIDVRGIPGLGAREFKFIEDN